jgi:hypothetical protein
MSKGAVLAFLATGLVVAGAGAFVLARKVSDVHTDAGPALRFVGRILG